MDDVAEVDNIVVFEFFHEGNFADGGGGCSFLVIKVDFFQRNCVSRVAFFSLEDSGIRANTSEECIKEGGTPRRASRVVGSSYFTRVKHSLRLTNKGETGPGFGLWDGAGSEGAATDQGR